MSKWRRQEIEYVEGDKIEPSNIIKIEVERYAENFAKLAGFLPGHDPAMLAKKLGGKLSYQELDEWASEDGSIFIHGESDFDILLSRYTSPRRDRFTIAHELGHYFLHSNQGETPIIAHRKGSTRIEWEANWFAAGLLMPRAAFTRLWKKTEDLSRVASKFGVSEDAAEIRRNAVCNE